MSLGGGWVAFGAHGYPDPSYDLAQLWHQSTDRWWRLPDGCLGRESLTRLFMAADGRVLAHDRGVLHRLPALDALISEIEKLKKGRIEPTAWSEWGASLPGDASGGLKNG